MGSGSERACSARETFLLAIFFACLTGFAEVALVLLRRDVVGTFTRVTPHLVWMAPFVDLVLFCTLAAALVALGSAWRAVRRLPNLVFVYSGLSGLAVSLVLPHALHPLAAGLLILGVAVQARRLASSHATTIRGRLVPATAVMTGVIAAIAIVFMDRGIDHPPDSTPRSAEMRPGRPNLLLLVIDTGRASSFGLYGNDRRTSPHIDSLAGTGAVFERAVPTAPWTLPSHASMFTGRLPHELSVGWESPLDDAHPTLAEVLTRDGYATAGFVANLL
ncbi:MAG: sulfatase-like hydrolase/transferase, partial [Gemmatimonadota bacterium]